MPRILLTAILFVSASVMANAEDLCPKYGQCVDAKHFTCTDTARSSFVKRVCYDEKDRYLVLQLKKTYYHYCEVDPGTVGEMIKAESIGRYYNANIKVSANGGRYDCRTHTVPMLK